jgi:hypothetical protein
LQGSDDAEDRDGDEAKPQDRSDAGPQASDDAATQARGDAELRARSDAEARDSSDAETQDRDASESLQDGDDAGPQAPFAQPAALTAKQHPTRSGTGASPYKRSDGKVTRKIAFAGSRELFKALGAYVAQLPPSLGRADWIEQVIWRAMEEGYGGVPPIKRRNKPGKQKGRG